METSGGLIQEGKEELTWQANAGLEAVCLHAWGNKTLLQGMKVRGQKRGTITSVFFILVLQLGS